MIVQLREVRQAQAAQHQEGQEGEAGQEGQRGSVTQRRTLVGDSANLQNHSVSWSPQRSGSLAVQPAVQQNHLLGYWAGNEDPTPHVVFWPVVRRRTADAAPRAGGLVLLAWRAFALRLAAVIVIVP